MLENRPKCLSFDSSNLSHSSTTCIDRKAALKNGNGEAGTWRGQFGYETADRWNPNPTIATSDDNQKIS
jgi:hypothetical protein